MESGVTVVVGGCTVWEDDGASEGVSSLIVSRARSSPLAIIEKELKAPGMLEMFSWGT